MKSIKIIETKDSSWKATRLKGREKMQKFTELLERLSQPFVKFVNTNKAVIAVRNGMIGILPLFLFGSLILIITNFPYMNEFAPELHAFLNEFFGKGTEATIGMAGFAVCLAIAYHYSVQLKINPLHGTITALSSWVIVTSTTIVTSGTIENGATVVENVTVSGVIPTSVMGSVGMVTGIIIALASIKLFSIIQNRNLVIKMPDSVPENVSKSFAALIPMFITFFIFLAVYYVFAQTSYGTLQDFIYGVISAPLTLLATNPITLLIITALQQVLWFFGIHGTILMQSVFGPFLWQAATANMEAFQAGEEVPYIISQTFIDVYQTAGAAGILAFIIAAFTVAKSESIRFISKTGISPALFNIQEPVTFGAPLVFSPIMFIPFVLIPVVQMGLAYVLCVIGFAPVPVLVVPWTTPIFLSGFLATGYDIMGAVTQLILLAVAVLIWIPFIKIQDNSNLKNQ